MKIYNQLKKELESGKKSIAALKKIMKNEGVNEERQDTYIQMLLKDKDVHKTLRGWFFKTMYFELKSKKASVEIENLTSWVGMCPPPPPNDKLKIMMSNNIWLPHPRQYLDLRDLNSLRNLMLSEGGKKKYTKKMLEDPKLKKKFIEDWNNWKSFGQISAESDDFREEFRKVALEFNYAKYFTKEYYKENPTFGYSVKESLPGKE